MLKILVTFAVRSEFASWRRMAGFVRVDREGTPLYRRQTAGSRIDVLVTGIGTRSVNAELRDLLKNSADVCIATGLAGSLKKEYGAGTILAAGSVRSNTNAAVIKSDASLTDLAKACGAAKVDCFFTSDSVVNSPSEKSALAAIADAVDMESYHILAEAERLRIRAVAVRAISDDAETLVPIDFNRVIDEQGEIGWLRTFCEVAKVPKRVPQLIRFGMQSSNAARNLARFLDCYVTSLAMIGDLDLAAVRLETR